MSVRLQVDHATTAPIDRVWAELTDWAGQARWIPLTEVTVTTEHDTGLGVRAEALSGFWVAGVPVGLLDRFVVTGWTPAGSTGAGTLPEGSTGAGTPPDGPPVAGPATAAELEVLHLGPYFTGEGVFRLEPQPAGGTRIVATEMITVPGGASAAALVRLLLPVLRIGFRLSLRRLAAVCEGGG